MSGSVSQWEFGLTFNNRWNGAERGDKAYSHYSAFQGSDIPIT
ncbi:hypothetical protein ACFSKU_15605 [Pontibacter silvestris]|uniref:Uncharacterized protein n=1 Tax=Pontibacter silvestris TaxID=2305183 RepID=A0ABW4X213_9BACT|nr:hypothetical protein [Pontibacter silvestris]